MLNVLSTFQEEWIESEHPATVRWVEESNLQTNKQTNKLSNSTYRRRLLWVWKCGNSAVAVSAAAAVTAAAAAPILHPSCYSRSFVRSFVRTHDRPIRDEMKWNNIHTYLLEKRTKEPFRSTKTRRGPRLLPRSAVPLIILYYIILYYWRHQLTN